MSSRLWKFRIQDILDAISLIQGYVEGMSFDQFCRDRKTLDAVERNFILIGEAARQVPNHVRESFSNIPWRDMSDMRNYVVHHYWGVEPRRVWAPSITICLLLYRCCGRFWRRRENERAVIHDLQDASPLCYQAKQLATAGRGREGG